VKRICRYLPLLPLLPFCVPLASAQSSVDFRLGFGTAHDKANAGGIDSAESANAYGTCTPGTGDPYCLSNPSLSGFFLGFGGDIMLWSHFGIGADVDVQPARSNYGPLQYRQTFYDFDGVFAPFSSKRVQLDLRGGIGGAHTSFYISQGVGNAFNQAYAVGTTNHFQLHAGVGVSLFVTDHVFIRPEFDYHYVPSFTDQFGSNSVPAGMVWIGYNFGGQ